MFTTQCGKGLQTRISPPWATNLPRPQKLPYSPTPVTLNQIEFWVRLHDCGWTLLPDEAVWGYEPIPPHLCSTPFPFPSTVTQTDYLRVTGWRGGVGRDKTGQPQGRVLMTSNPVAQLQGSHQIAQPLEHTPNTPRTIRNDKCFQTQALL